LDKKIYIALKNVAAVGIEKCFSMQRLVNLHFNFFQFCFTKEILIRRTANRWRFCQSQLPMPESPSQLLNW